MPAIERSAAGPLSGIRLSAAVAVVCVLLGVLLAGGCERKPRYSQATPDDVIESAAAMVKHHDAERLPDLVYAETPEMREFLRRLGTLFGKMQRLAGAVERRWPEDYASLREEGVRKASEQGSSTIFGMLNGGGRGGQQPNPDEARSAINALLADPYGWIERNAARLSTVKTADDAASVLLDGQPAIPLVGLPMREEDGKWYIAIPSGMPPLSNAWPRTKQQWSILGSLIRVLDNAVTDLGDDVERGRVGSVQQLTDELQKRAMWPAMIAFAAYGKELDVRQRTDRRMRAFRSKQREWIESRRVRGGSESAGVSPRLVGVIESLAPVRLEQAARKQQLGGIDKMSNGQFEDLIIGWLSDAGLRVDATGPLDGDQIDRAVADWSAARAAEAKRGR